MNNSLSFIQLFTGINGQNLLKKERQAHILHQVNLHNRVLTADLCASMKVSEDTIRRDLAELADEGKVIKIHGGALSHSFQASLQPTPVYSHDEKRIIARKAIRFIRNGMFVLTTGGTTIIEMARMLPKDLDATFISPSLPAVMEYVRHPGIETIFVGSKISRSSLISVGGETISKIRELKADICFLGINAISAEHGVTDNDWDVVQVKKAMIESSATVIALTIAEKINVAHRIKVCDISSIDALITDLDPENPLFDPFRAAGVQVV
jgi:DeoR/GlpR family transcriptional regulator of sugar metabolism